MLNFSKNYLYVPVLQKLFLKGKNQKFLRKISNVRYGRRKAAKNVQLCVIIYFVANEN